MASLQNYNGRFCESEYENAFLSFLEDEGWQYLAGNSLVRASKRDVLYADDLEQFLSKTNPDLDPEEVRQIMDAVRLAGAESDFATLHKVYGWMVNGIQFTPRNGEPRMVPLIDFVDPARNIFRAVNQFSVEYTNNGQAETRRPDILLFVNGLPLCIVELKNPADANATIYDAWEQINIRYRRDIPHLLHYCPLACISDGVKTRLGTVRTPYEHFYAWRRVNDGDKVSILPFDEVQTMIQGVYSPARFLEIFRDYIYFQDSEYDGDEVEIVCRYPQFFAARLLKQSIIKSVKAKSGKGGTYFGATGCGKTYTMAFLARQLALRCTDVPEIGSPTVVMIVDRDDLQKQGAKLFTKSKEFLNLGEVSVVPNRRILREELKTRESGGFYICTIQKFCDGRMTRSASSMTGQTSSVFRTRHTGRSSITPEDPVQQGCGRKHAGYDLEALCKGAPEAFPMLLCRLHRNAHRRDLPDVRRGDRPLFHGSGRRRRTDRVHQVSSPHCQGASGSGEGAADRGIL
jgi:type I restriction enzyme R subunit